MPDFAKNNINTVYKDAIAQRCFSLSHKKDVLQFEDSMRKKLILAIIVVVSAAGLFLGYQGVRYFEEKNERALFSEIQPVRLINCTMKRFGAANDGGYLMCENLMEGVQSAYSYGIGGRDEWGCDISRKYNLRVHQYDCFDTTRPVCSRGLFTFHEECLGGTVAKTDNKNFDTLTNQIVKNGDSHKTLVVKMDVEGSEWDSLLMTSDEVLNSINQLAIEFHVYDHVKYDRKYIETIKKLKKNFVVAHVHFNNCCCRSLFSPFPSLGFEVLLVNKRIGIIDASGNKPLLPHSLDAPNLPDRADCSDRVVIWEKD